MNKNTDRIDDLSEDVTELRQRYQEIAAPADLIARIELPQSDTRAPRHLWRPAFAAIAVVAVVVSVLPNSTPPAPSIFTPDWSSLTDLSRAAYDRPNSISINSASLRSAKRPSIPNKPIWVPQSGSPAQKQPNEQEIDSKENQNEYT